jgi:succinate dehydrogenase / fumarate reductase iron-sulfur subunit
MRLTLNILRFDPHIDDKPSCSEYAVDWEQHETVLDLLMRARLQDLSLAFRRSCRSGICGSCGMQIGGRSRLACQTLVRDVAGDGGSLSIAPLPGFRQLRDLVVDMDPFFDALTRVLPWVILCGVCDAEVRPSGSVTPAALVKNVRLAVDPRDALGRERMKIAGLTEAGLQTFRELLVSVCPKGIKLPSVTLE